MKKILIIAVCLLSLTSIATACEPGKCDFAYDDLSYFHSIGQEIDEASFSFGWGVLAANRQHQSIIGHARGDGISFSDTAYLRDVYGVSNRLPGAESNIYGVVESLLTVDAETSERCNIGFAAKADNYVLNTATVTPGSKKTRMYVHGEASLVGTAGQISGSYKLERMDFNHLASPDGDILATASRTSINSNLDSSGHNKPHK